MVASLHWLSFWLLSVVIHQKTIGIARIAEFKVKLIAGQFKFKQSESEQILDFQHKHSEDP